MSGAREQQRYLAMDGVRGTAALCVALFHITLAHGDWLPGAYVSVDFFFCLSGFVLAGAYRKPLEEGLGLSRFLKLRWARLYPMYAVGLAVGLLAHGLSYRLGAPVTWGRTALLLTADGVFMWPALLVSQLGFATYYSMSAPFPYNPPSWSLFFELVSNALFAGLRPRGWRLALFIALAGAAFIATTLAFGHPAGWGGYSFWAGAPRAIFGFYLGYGVRELADAGFFPRWRLHYLGPAAVLLAAFAPFGSGTSAFLFFAILVAPAILVASLSDPRSAVVAAIYRELGRLSYPLYALHWPAFKLYIIVASAWIYRREDYSPGPVGVIAFTAALALASWLLAVYAEPPMRRAVARFFSALARKSPNEAPARA